MGGAALFFIAGSNFLVSILQVNKCHRTFYFLECAGGNERNSAALEQSKYARLQRKIGVEIDSIFGAETEAAVRRIQHTRGLTVDGVENVKAWNAWL